MYYVPTYVAIIFVLYINNSRIFNYGTIELDDYSCTCYNTIQIHQLTATTIFSVLLTLILVYLPIAVLFSFVTCRIILVDDGLVRTSTNCTVPSFSLTLYFGFMKDTVISMW